MLKAQTKYVMKSTFYERKLKSSLLGASNFESLDDLARLRFTDKAEFENEPDFITSFWGTPGV